MGNKNDRWSQLSMQQRADLIKLYTNNGITSLDTIKKNYNSFDIGGDTENKQENRGYITTTKQDLQDVESFNRNWYKYRDTQLANVIKDVYDAKYTEGLNFLQKGFPNLTDQTKVANAARNYINKRLDTVTEFDSKEALEDLKTRSWLENEYYDIFPSRKPDPELIGPPKQVSDSDLKFITEFLYRGIYNPETHSIVYDKDYKNSSTKVHERTHASVPVIPFWSQSPILDPISSVQFKEGVEADPGYYDAIDEIYARLMQLRFVNGLDPNHTYTLDEVKAMRNDSKFKDFNIFNRYTDESILMLLNEVAQNTTDSNRLDYVNSDNIAAFGGKINRFDTGGNTDGDGNIVLDWIRKQLYDKIDPVGYNQFVDRVKAAILGKGEDRYNKARDDIFATYLKIPKNERHNVEDAKKVSDATYTPAKSSEDTNYHKIDLTDKEKDALIYDALRNNTNVGDNSRSHVFEQFFGPHQVGRGKDEKGEYVSYYDLWDLDPSSGESKTGEFEFLKSLQEILGAKDMSLGIGEPVEFYDRIYLNDYYGVTPQVDEGDIEGGYLPLAYVESSTGSGSTLTGEDYYNAGETSLPTYSKGGKLNRFGGGGDTNNNDSKKTSNNKEALKAKIDKTLFFTIAKQLGFTPKQLQDLAYLFGSDAAVSQKGYAGIEDILRILSPDYKPTNPMDDNKQMFLYGNVNGLSPAENTNGKDFSEYINATYPGANIKSYQGVINPFNEYVVDIRDKGLLEELAAKGENLYVDADVEHSGQQYNYRDDVASYAFKPVIGNNGLMISSADLYDFGPDYNPAKYDPNASKTDSFLGKLESKLLGFVGNPYILRQDNIPIRFIDYNNASKEDVSRAEDLKYAIKNGMMSAKEFDDGTDLDKKLAEVLGNEFLEPITVTAEAKKAKGGKLNKFKDG